MHGVTQSQQASNQPHTHTQEGSHRLSPRTVNQVRERASNQLQTLNE